eukprot:GHRR01013449.1.p1 GENE.GHRR01013449.1~~GHRR01013449.1.p1  ORF type:complete len:310 (+),score=85.29 GHRR01013449.1:659-1588(+)
MSAAGSGEVRLPKTMKVKNKQPAHRQITAEQILREAKEIQLEDDFKAPKTIITDPEELAEYRLKKRKEFEDNVRRVGRWNHTIWIKYAQWEESQKDFRRARSVWERAIGCDYRNVTFWLKYAEMEMRHRFVNHARNVWDRAVSVLPRIDQLWYKYIHMEEMCQETAKARLIFDRWVAFEPDHAAWMAYIRVSRQIIAAGTSTCPAALAMHAGHMYIRHVLLDALRLFWPGSDPCWMLLNFRCLCSNVPTIAYYYATSLLLSLLRSAAVPCCTNHTVWLTNFAPVLAFVKSWSGSGINFMFLLCIISITC